MGIEMNLGNPFANLIAGGEDSKESSDSTTKKKQAELYLNPSIPFPYTDENGEQQVEYISLPFGLPIDTMTPNKVTTRNPRMKAIMQGGNTFLQMLIDEGAKLAPGEDVEIQNVTLRLRRRNSNQSAVLEDGDPVAAVFGKLKLVG